MVYPMVLCLEFDCWWTSGTVTSPDAIHEEASERRSTSRRTGSRRVFMRGDHCDRNEGYGKDIVE